MNQQDRDEFALLIGSIDALSNGLLSYLCKAPDVIVGFL